VFKKASDVKTEKILKSTCYYIGFLKPTILKLIEEPPATDPSSKAPDKRTLEPSKNEQSYEPYS